MDDTGGVSGTLASGRDAFGRRRWGEAIAALQAADADAPLGVDDLERLAVARYLTGDEAGSTETWVRAHHACVDQDDLRRAARCAFWLAFGIDITGTAPPAAGWYERARRLLAGVAEPCPEHAYVRVAPALARLLVDHDADGSAPEFAEIAAVGDRLGDVDLATIGRLGWGHALVLLDERAAGLAMLDEVMVAVTAGEVTPVLAGLSYCAVIEVCRETYDLPRAKAWTDALTSWCASQPDLEPYRGNCLVHRAEVLQVEGDWAEAAAEVERAVVRLSRPPGQMGVGAACYQQGELHRLRGETAAAEDAYRRASHWGHLPQPGLALLRLAAGRAAAARSAIDRAVHDASGPLPRSRLLPAQVEIALAAGDPAAARGAADELAEIAAGVDAPWLRAEASHAGGAVLLAEGEPEAALAALREAHAGWLRLGTPYEAARTRVLVARACRDLGDPDGADLELDAALATFERLGAVPDAARARRLVARPDSTPPGALSRREREVLALVATGRTNRAVASELHISEKTVARHLSNIFTKLDVSSRAAATAWAYEHDLAFSPYTG